MAGGNYYLQATRHPWPSFVLLLPLLLTYEVGVLWLGGPQPDTLRNGADTWMRWGLEAVGLGHPCWPPALLAVFFLLWCLLRSDSCPKDLIGVVSAMVIEAVFFALGLWGLSRALGPVLEGFGIPLAWHPATAEALRQTITFIGAGVYEEVLFRLLLFTGLVRLMQLVFIPLLLAVPVAASASAALFSAAHYVGPYGEVFHTYTFLFRMLAGLYFAAVYQFRGFGIAAGSHALYDVVVGVSLS
jgi:hypothetical protein